MNAIETAWAESESIAAWTSSRPRTACAAPPLVPPRPSQSPAGGPAPDDRDRLDAMVTWMVHQAIVELCSLVRFPHTEDVAPMVGEIARYLPWDDRECERVVRMAVPLAIRYLRDVRAPLVEYRSTEVVPDHGLPGGLVIQVGDRCAIDVPWCGSVTPCLTYPAELVGDLLDEGRSRWGARFLGIRLMYLLAPRRSVLFTSGGRIVTVGSDPEALAGRDLQ